MNILLLLLLGVVPDDCTQDYLTAVNGNAMGWFCARWDCGDREFQADSQMNLYRLVAGDILAGRVYDLRPWGHMKTVIIKAPREDVHKWVLKQFPKIPPDQVLKTVNQQEYEWRLSPTSQGVIQSLLKAFPNKVSIGQRH